MEMTGTPVSYYLCPSWIPRREIHSMPGGRPTASIRQFIYAY